jgi:RNA polymerase sigma-70 factor (ECF subfamily)
MDQSYIKQLKLGYTSCFEEIYYRYNKKLYAYFFKRIGIEVICEDLIQETFIRFWHYRYSLDETLSIDIQLFRIAKTTLINVAKKRSKQLEISVSNSELPDRVEEDSTLHILKEKKEKLLHLITALPTSRKKIIELRMDGYSNKEIAGMLNISVKTVENSLNAAYQELRQLSSMSAILLLVLLP